MLNFKQFMTNAGAFMTGVNDYDALTKKMSLPDTTLDLPSTESPPAKVFRIKKAGKMYEIFADRNLVWSCPASHYEHLLRVGKAPHVGDSVKLSFYGDGSVKSFEVVNS